MYTVGLVVYIHVGVCRVVDWEVLCMEVCMVDVKRSQVWAKVRVEVV